MKPGLKTGGMQYSIEKQVHFVCKLYSFILLIKIVSSTIDVMNLDSISMKIQCYQRQLFRRITLA